MCIVQMCTWLMVINDPVIKRNQLVYKFLDMCVYYKYLCSP